MNRLIKALIYSFALLVILTGVLFLINFISPGSKIPETSNEITTETEEEKKNMFIAQGKFVCLPVIDENKPHNDICLFGIQTNDGYYRLQTNENENFLATLENNQNIQVSGELIAENDGVHQSSGTIHIEEIKNLEEKNNILPENFKADYISFSNYKINKYKTEMYPRLEFWPENGEIECEEINGNPLKIAKKKINGKKYCIANSSEGAAGSVYSQYAYGTVIDDYIYTVIFLARYSNCGNYPEEEMAKCENERNSFNLDILVDEEIKKIK